MSTPQFKNFLFEITPDGIAIVTINRPEVRNAMDNDSWDSMYAISAHCMKDSSIKAVVITGAGDKSFAAGADLNSIKAKTPADVFMNFSTTRESAYNWENMPKPVIAAVNGYAFGGGCEIAMSCDIRIASTRAKFALPECGVGVIPGNGGTQRLARLVGYGLAKDMILTGRVLNAQEALDNKLVTYVVEPDELMNKAMEIARTAASKAPTAIALAKKVLPASMNADLVTGVTMESLAFAAAQGTADKLEGCNAFLEKRNPEFPGK